MSDQALRTWVSDQLHGIVGYSEGHLADFVLSLSKSARSPAALLQKLHEADVPQSEATRRFAADLFGKVPRGGPSSEGAAAAAAKKQRKEAIGLLRQNEAYGMVSDGEDDDGEDEVNKAVQKALQEKERERKRKEKKRKEPPPKEPPPRGKPEEDLRDEDTRERDAFAERLRLRDLEKTKKLGEASKEEEELEKRREEQEKLLAAGSAEEKAAALEELRRVSRRK
jgi:pre-mRNA-splicing factor ATP-dependent RNA helicase DHX16